jgi:hypothetical protein
MSGADVEISLLCEAGQALYGERWQTDLANDLQVADRTVRRWVSGASPIPSGLWSEINDILRKHSDSIAEVRRKIAAHTK